jgi:hypothetical protein
VLVNGKAFTSGTIPYGSRVNVTSGKLTLRTDTGTMTVSGAGVSAKFVLQRRTDNGRPIVQLLLFGGDFSVCGKTKRKSSSVAKAKPQKPVRKLLSRSGSEGGFRIVGKYAAGTDRGTFWLTVDRCDGTLTQVRQGTVSVRDLVKRKTVVVTAGHSYLAKKP